MKELLSRIFAEARTIAVVGIKPESHAGQPAHDVPAYMQAAGYEIIPVPVYYPDVTEILGRPVYRSLAAIPGKIDLVNVFRRSVDVAQHADDILAVRPKFVWLQLGIEDEASAARWRAAGIEVVEDRCIMVDHRRFAR